MIAPSAVPSSSASAEIRIVTHRPLRIVFQEPPLISLQIKSQVRESRVNKTSTEAERREKGTRNRLSPK
jgi:hypothetical protein